MANFLVLVVWSFEICQMWLAREYGAIVPLTIQE